MKKENKRQAPDGKTCTIPALRLSHGFRGKRKGKAIKGKGDDLRTKKEKDRHGSDRDPSMVRILPVLARGPPALKTILMTVREPRMNKIILVLAREPAMVRILLVLARGSHVLRMILLLVLRCGANILASSYCLDIVSQ